MPSIKPCQMIKFEFMDCPNGIEMLVTIVGLYIIYLGYKYIYKKKNDD
ncbi:hypothetical protein JOC86_002212 [Bacillus pakistanensis]|uniref:Uncharacterized protein n=1 Tax=Rossellomorea pakistanensis TaxID=992288 RepID=A0ABS2NCY1_9BACI|nr:hypothetical protein [Bacillus pakistanensis]